MSSSVRSLEAGSRISKSFTTAFTPDTRAAAGGGDFSIAATPASLTISSGDPASYTVTTTATGGFAGTITFAVTGVPPGMTPSFNPATVVGSGSTTLSLTGDNPTAGTYTLTITGTSGGLTHSTTVTITISS